MSDYEIKVSVEYKSLPFVRLNPCRAKLVAFLPAAGGALAPELAGAGCWGFSHFIDLLSSTSDGKHVVVSESVEAESWNELEQKVDELVYALRTTLAENVKVNRESKSATPAPKTLYFYV
jgi:hypothetical protein